VEKYGTARATIHENIIRCMHIACWIIKATDAHSEYEILYLLLFHINSGPVDAPQCYVYTLACLV
jgi:hypothetical protein